ncbi:RNA polymerase sigma factor [Candidatus Korobacter versatilis]|nr:sigma-70 family RNA polymerase sigma factor [Candidatus Koribacter versatilis]
MSSAPGAGPEIAQAITAFCAQQFGACGAAKFEISREELSGIVSAVVGKWNASASSAEVQAFLGALRVEELVLTRACAAGNNTAWELFLNRYRAVLYGAAYKIAGDDATARELADSLYAELYGVSEKGAERSSKLLYYSGRGSLEGWLRTIVAQEYVNRYRRTRRETSLEEQVEEGKQFEATPSAPDPPPDNRMDHAISAEIAALHAEDRLLLATYFLDGRKLAEIARVQRVHESTISRKLERVTGLLRKRIRKRLIDGGMSPRQADEAMGELDVRDVQVPIEKSLRQEPGGGTFYKGSEP